MAETKRVSDQYKITAPLIILDGNLLVQGSTTTVDSVNSVVSDNIIVLNDGEVGAGVTLGSAGIEVDRGTEPNASFVWDETTDTWAAQLNGSLTNLTSASPTLDDHVATKDYVDNISGATAPGNNTEVVFNNLGNFGASPSFTWDGTNLNIGTTEIASNIVRTNASNADLELYASGAGFVYLRSVIKLEDEVSDPSPVAGNNLVYSKTPGEGETGLYYVNSTSSGEVISKNKAIFYSLVL